MAGRTEAGREKKMEGKARHGAPGTWEEAGWEHRRPRGRKRETKTETKKETDRDRDLQWSRGTSVGADKRENQGNMEGWGRGPGQR